METEREKHERLMDTCATIRDSAMSVGGAVAVGI